MKRRVSFEKRALSCAADFILTELRSLVKRAIIKGVLNEFTRKAASDADAYLGLYRSANCANF